MKDELPSLNVPRAQLAVAVMGTTLRPSQRMRAQGVLALTGQLVRAAQAGQLHDAAPMLAERRRLVRELRAGIAEDVSPLIRSVEHTCVEAVADAVAESDLALDALRAVGEAAGS